MANRPNNKQELVQGTGRARLRTAVKHPARDVKTSQRNVEQQRKAATDVSFVAGDLVVYPSRGVGEVIKIESEVIDGHKTELFFIRFDHDHMTVRVPLSKASSLGLRNLSTLPALQTALTVLTGRATRSHTPWSRVAHEYATKINTGNLVLIAEVVRDLHQQKIQKARPYAHQMLYEQALDHLTRELAAVEQIKLDAAIAQLDRLLNAA